MTTDGARPDRVVPGRAPTITDVATLAGVSVGTVSRVLTGAPTVKPWRLQRVRDAIETLGYRPNPAARALSTARSSMITVLTGNTSRFGYSQTIRGIAAAAAERGYAMTVVIVESVDQPAVRQALDLLSGNATTGLIVLRFDEQSAAAALLVPPGLPTLVLGDASGAHPPRLVREEEDLAHELVTHMLDLGHPTVHHVRIPIVQPVSGRSTGWLRALTDRGVRVPDVLDVGWEPAAGRDAGRVLGADPSVTAVFCGNDETAMAVIRGLVDVGRRVPEDVSVAGFDDHPLAAVFVPALTTVAQDFVALGRSALVQLLSMVDGAPAMDDLSQEARLIVRDSVAPPPQRT